MRFCFFFFKQKTAYEMRISDWSSDVCSSDLYGRAGNDTLTGGLGNDTLSGDGGNDTFVFNAGDGQDVITEWGDSGGGDSGTDVLELGAGILPADVTVAQANGGGDLVLSIAGGTDSIRTNYTINYSHQQI